MTVGLAMLAAAFAGPALADPETDDAEQSEQPGAEIEMDVGPGGNVEIGREKRMQEPIEIVPGTPIEPLDDPDIGAEPDPIDDALPGEGPEDLSGPDDEDDLPD
jgi:hypothetical protein